MACVSYAASLLYKGSVAHALLSLNSMDKLDYLYRADQSSLLIITYSHRVRKQGFPSAPP